MRVRQGTCDPTPTAPSSVQTAGALSDRVQGGCSSNYEHHAAACPRIISDNTHHGPCHIGQPVCLSCQYQGRRSLSSWTCGEVIPKDPANLTRTGDKMELQRLKGCRYLLRTLLLVEGSCAISGSFTFIQAIKQTHYSLYVPSLNDSIYRMATFTVECKREATSNELILNCSERT